MSNGFAPEFGNTVGTVFNTITKSGANEFHGEGSYLFRRTDFSARPKLLAATGLVPDVNVDAYAVDGGGRLIRDKLFFFGAFEHVKRDLPGVVTVSAANIAALGLPADYINAIPFRQSVYFYMGKGDWQINDKNRLSVRYMHHANDSPYNNSTIGGLNLISRSYNFVDRSHVGAVQLVSTINASMVNELRGQVAYRGQHQDTLLGDRAPARRSWSAASPISAVPRARASCTKRPRRNSPTISATSAGRTPSSSAAARAAMRDTQMQAHVRAVHVRQHRGVSGGGERDGAEGLHEFSADSGQPVDLITTRCSPNFFAQDTWKPMRNLTVTYGVRYDVYKTPEADKTSPFAYSQSFRTDKNNFGTAARLRVGTGQGPEDRDPREHGHLLRSAQTDQYRQALPSTATRSSSRCRSTPHRRRSLRVSRRVHAACRRARRCRTDINTVSPDFATLYSINANFSITREITQLDVDHCAAISTPRATACRCTATSTWCRAARSWRTAGRSSARRAYFPRFGNIISAESVGHSTYNGAESDAAQADCRAGTKCYATYTWSHAIDDAPEQNNIDSGAFLLADSDQPPPRPRRFADRQAARLQHDRRVHAGIQDGEQDGELPGEPQPPVVLDRGVDAATCSTWAATRT